jgi:diacylglycerol kinase family enzyme
MFSPRLRRRPSQQDAAAHATGQRTIPVVVNDKAGTAPQVDRSELRKLFAARGLDVEFVTGDSLEDAAKAALVHRPAMIVAAGGDGTISAVARAAVGTGIPLGILPLGTLNHFARDLGIPPSLPEAIDVLGDGQWADVDVGEVNGNVFVNNSSIGLYPRLVRHRERLQHRLGHGKWRALLRAVLIVLRRYPLVHVVVQTGERRLVRRTPLVFVGNNAYAMQGLEIGRRERLTDGKLCLYIPRRGGRFALFGIALRALLGRIDAEDEFDLAAAPELRIVTPRRRVRTALDGEVRTLRSPLEYRVRPGALRVVVPGPSPSDRDGA